MIETYIRPQIQPLFDRIGISLSYLCTSNTITACAFITGIGSGICIALGNMPLALLLLVVSGLCDVLDGTVARLQKTGNSLGAYYDLISDRMVEAAVILGFTIAYPENYFAYITFFIAVMLHFSTFIAAGALFPNRSKKSMHYDASMVERAEAFVVFIVMILYPHYAGICLLSFNCIVFIDGIARLIRVATHAKSLKKKLKQKKST